MGLDTVELVMETEEKFGIKLPDEELGKTTTVGDLHELVSRFCFDKHNTTTCNSQRAFYQLRQTMISELGFQKDEIRPQTQTANIFPEMKRKETWHSVSEAAELSFPRVSASKKTLIDYIDFEPFLSDCDYRDACWFDLHVSFTWYILDVRLFFVCFIIFYCINSLISEFCYGQRHPGFLSNFGRIVKKNNLS